MTKEHTTLQSDGRAFAPYLDNLSKRERDMEGAEWAKGAEVLRDPFEADNFMRDNSGNRKMFKARDYTWSEVSRRRRWFGEPESATGATRSQVFAVAGDLEGFCSALAENIAEAPGDPIPRRRQPPWLVFKPWESRIRSATLVHDLTPALKDALKERAGAPADLTWPAEWNDDLTRANKLEVYEIRGGGQTIHVVVGFITPLEVRLDGEPRLASPDPGLLSDVFGLHGAWCDSNDGTSPDYVYFTLASVSPWLQEPTEDRGRWVALSHRADDGRWCTRTPPALARRAALRSFYDRLHPLTRKGRISSIESFVDATLPGCEYDLTVDRIKRGMAAKGDEFNLSSIRDALFEMQEAGEYRVYKTKSGQLAVGRSKGHDQAGLSCPRHKGHHTWQIIGTVVAAAPWILRESLPITWPIWINWGVALTALYVSQCIQANLGRRTNAE